MNNLQLNHIAKELVELQEYLRTLSNKHDDMNDDINEVADVLNIIGRLTYEPK